MRATTAILFAISCMTQVNSLAIDGPSTINGQPMPDRWIRYDLTPVNTTTSEVSLIPRTNVRVCERVLTATSQCIGLVSQLIIISKAIGSAIKAISDAGSCGKSYGSLDGVSWVYYATGSNCDTTAEAATIQGAIRQHLATIDGNTLCSTDCLDLTHSGTWSGWLLIGPTSNFDSTRYCGESLSFGACTSGGKNNI